MSTIRLRQIDVLLNPTIAPPSSFFATNKGFQTHYHDIHEIHYTDSGAATGQLRLRNILAQHQYKNVNFYLKQ